VAFRSDARLWTFFDRTRLHPADRSRNVNALARLIARRIATTGPITVADYMATVLGHPEHGYYMTRDPLGRAGDFITAPEISQVFGELLGIWCVAAWRTMGAPAAFNLVELGPGRGTLMADALRAASQAPDFVRAARITLVEMSPVLRASQKTALQAYDVVWCDSLDDVSDGPILLFANEFFDALPVHQLVRTEKGWCERLVGQDEAGFRFMLSGETTPVAALLAPALRLEAPVGAIAEVQPAGISIATAIAERVDTDGGAALIIDYGHETSAAGDTLQAVREHEAQDIFDAPGEADLTVHVDFDAIGRAIVGQANLFGPVDQGTFLQRMGISVRAEQLEAQATAKQASDIASGVRRLITADEMGTLFKVIGLVPNGLTSLPGFEN
jgi:NADH dehydrogenase [ubiquinone] 1 alpha subcomplex assembly factor 7